MWDCSFLSAGLLQALSGNKELSFLCVFVSILTKPFPEEGERWNAFVFKWCQFYWMNPTPWGTAMQLCTVSLLFKNVHKTFPSYPTNLCCAKGLFKCFTTNLRVVGKGPKPKGKRIMCHRQRGRKHGKDTNKSAGFCYGKEFTEFTVNLYPFVPLPSLFSRSHKTDCSCSV